MKSKSSQPSRGHRDIRVNAVLRDKPDLKLFTSALIDLAREMQAKEETKEKAS